MNVKTLSKSGSSAGFYACAMRLVILFLGLSGQVIHAQESQPPTLEKLLISPSSIDVSQQTQASSIRLIVNNDSAIAQATFTLKNLDTSELLEVTQVGDWEMSGSLHKATFNANFTNANSAGTWVINDLEITDTSGNTSLAYKQHDDLISAQHNPFLSVYSDASLPLFNALLSANEGYSTLGNAQTSTLNLSVKDAVKYIVWLVPNENTIVSEVTFTDAISLTQDCEILTSPTHPVSYAKCQIVSTNNNEAITAVVNTLSSNANTFGFSVWVQPSDVVNNTSVEADWISNYIEFPVQDFDQDGYPNEQDLDDDNDAVPDELDAFPLDASESNDFDNDGMGDNADLDDDNDGVDDTQDAFPLDASENADNDADGQGNNSDTDDDNDGVPDSNDAFMFDSTESIDTDADGLGNNADLDDDNDGAPDIVDAFALDNTESLDSDNDGIGNNADPDDDNDAVIDSEDAFPRDPSEWLDTDGDGQGNNADEDDDNDGVRDVDDLFPLDPGEYRDTDKDGVGDDTDSDDDNDGILDFADAFPYNANESKDTDGDGIGNNADTDDDNDGLDDEFDAFPQDATEISDFDGDGIGNNADNDDDNDGVIDRVDAFPFAVTEWFDTDNDGIGNNADLDNDNDGVDDEFDAFDNDASETKDNDADGIGNNADLDDDNDGALDKSDAFPFDETESLDTDLDGVGNNVDTDDDGDNVPDEQDLFPLDPLESSDNDADGIGNNADPDDDNDGIIDILDVFPFDDSETLDNDKDGVGDNADTDDDNDGFEDDNDVFPFDPAEWADNDSDGLGDNRDADDDNDGVLDQQDAFPFDNTETYDNDQDGIGNNTDLDDDNDGVLDTADAFPFSDAESVDSDNDGIGNNADNDDDNDGIVDQDDSQPFNPTIGDDESPILDGIEDITLEATGPFTSVILEAPRVRDNNLNPATLSNNYGGPLALGKNVITWTAVDFAGNKSELAQTITIVDTTSPQFIFIDAIEINARGILTDVSKDIYLYASDAVDGQLLAQIVSESKLSAGEQTVLLSASDASGNEATIEVEFVITPHLTMQSTAFSGPGANLSIPVYLSGSAAVYPVTIEYSIVGPVTNLSNNSLVIEQGQIGFIPIDISFDASLGEQIWVSLDEAINANLNGHPSIQISIDTANVKPISTVVTKQNGHSVSVVNAEQGTVTLIANIDDVNINDTHAVEWHFSSQTALTQILNDLSLDEHANTFEFDPAQLTPDSYNITVQITETNTAEAYSLSITKPLIINVNASNLSAQIDSDSDGLNDAAEGLKDTDNDGIADYLDNDSNTTKLPTGISVQPISTATGLALTLGDIAKLAKGDSASSASISIQDIVNYGLTPSTSSDIVNDIHFVAVNSYLNFNIENLSAVGQVVPVVIPLNTGLTIPENAYYRKFNSQDGWFTFVEDYNNQIFSAAFDSEGNCPVTNSEQYTKGLQKGDTCIQLFIQDGGPNDGDLSANGLVKDPGVLASELTNLSPLINVPLQTTVREGEMVRVDASLTTDPEKDTLKYTWTQTGGRRINFGKSTTPLLSFVAPAVSNNETLMFSLAVFDGRNESTTSISVDILNQNSVPEVTINQHAATLKGQGTLSISASVNDSDGDNLAYEWRQTAGPTINLTNINSLTVSFTGIALSSNQTITLTLYVTDGTKEVSASTSVTIISEQTGQPGSSTNDSKGSGGSFGFWLLGLTIIMALYRRFNMTYQKRK